MESNKTHIANHKKLKHAHTHTQIKNFVEQKRPKDLEIRKQIDLGYSWDGRTAILFEIRPQWNDPSIIRENPIAKIVFTKTTKIWKLYWMRSTGKWEFYMPK